MHKNKWNDRLKRLKLEWAVFIAGFELVFIGLLTANSFGSARAKLLPGVPMRDAVWFLIGGYIISVIGATAILKKKRR